MSDPRLELLEVEVGGMSRPHLLDALRSHGVSLNSHAETLIDHPVFDRRDPERLYVVERTIAELGLSAGATLPEILSTATELNLRPCPPDADPYLRLAWARQANSSESVLSAGRSPQGAVKVAAAPLSDDVEYPKGFYLRVVDGRQWLCGYRCDDSHLFAPEDRFAFCATPGSGPPEA